MALLNKLFFPSTTPTPTTTTTIATGRTTITTTFGTAAAAITSATSTTALSLSSSSSLATTTTTTTTPTTAITGGSNWRTLAATAKRQTNNNNNNSNNQSAHSKNYLSQFPFDGRQVRVLLYRESDERRLLFDSNALEKVYLKGSTGSQFKTRHETTTGQHQVSNQHGFIRANNKDATVVHRQQQQQQQYHQQQQQQQQQHSNTFIEVCEEYGYRPNRPNTADINSIGEMVFGASAMTFRGTALKVHWLKAPARILCSQVFLAPRAPAGIGPSPYSTFSMSSLASPRTSISSEQGSIDGLSMNSFSMPFTVSVGRQMSLTPSDLSSVTSPLDVPDQRSLSATSDSVRTESHSSGTRYSYSTGTDSGYSGMSRGQLNSDQWSTSYQYSVRNSFGSITSSDQLDPLRKLSLDSSLYSNPLLLDDAASDGCLQRRISRNLRTSFENEHSMNDLIGFLSDNYYGAGTGTNAGGSEGASIGAAANYRRASYCANESRSNPEMGKRREGAAFKSLKRRSKLGLAVCITMSESFEEEMELFCSEHIALLECMLSRLRASTERAYINHKDFLQIVYQGWQDVQQWFNDMFTAPRIKCPVWLNITTSGSKYSKSVAERFIKELCWLLSFADTKDTNFFVSTMLTAVLTHHLGWVPTVSAFNSSSSRCETAAVAIEQRAKLLQVSTKHPYNALWAQMGDLYGAIGMPPKLARTVIYGTEKLSVERLLNILTYFIRCGEVRRAAKREDFDKELINSICKNASENSKKLYPYAAATNKTAGTGAGLKKSTGFLGGGLTRTQTCKQNLNTISDSFEPNLDDEEEHENALTRNSAQLVQTLKKNEIPNVLAFRDSRFVQQELRIGNFLMDTGIEKNSLIQSKLLSSKKQISGSALCGKDGRILLMVTTPENVELCMEEQSNQSSSIGSVEDVAMEAIDLEAEMLTPSEVKTPVFEFVSSNKKRFFWNVVPESIKEGLSLNYRNANNDGTAADNKLHVSLSDLITQNSMGKSDRMTWGIEPIKENVSLEEQIHFDLSQKLIEREHGISRNSSSSNVKTSSNSTQDVVFVLGDNEPLINLKKSTEDLLLATDGKDNCKNNTAGNQQQAATTQLCALHQCTHANMQAFKKHSGVKFNFEQFPQIATNYMRSKNLLLSNHELLKDKDAKLKMHDNSALDATTTTAIPYVNAFHETPTGSNTSSSTCVVCNSMLNSYQTPSNATELEFESDDVHCFTNTTTSSSHSGTSVSGQSLHTVSSAASVDTLKSALSPIASAAESEATPTTATTSAICVESLMPERKTTTFSGNIKKSVSQRGSISSVATKCAAVNEAMNFLKLPMSGIKELSQDDEGDMKLRAGFIPSLLLNVNDHYVSDVVLQGTSAAPLKWETHLRNDLTLAARSASLISQPAENIAIVADMEKWDVRVLSSQTQCFPNINSQSDPVGMSQMVASMLETVQAMNSSGISAYECLSFLEAKLQEIYLQSETLASFLMEADFCSLSAVAAALNLSENDVPLLLSIASIHTPQIGKKCGISFRR